ncbi:MAG TPA: hypothetical protein VMU25_03650 [Candidatus Paceibacterota bacterium]|nr:hypothetical protein [Candidatus Paceibacterota bacterium]
MKIVVVGFGWVGQANALALKLSGENVFFFDPKEPELHYAKAYTSIYAQIPRLTSVLEKDAADTCYIVCVGDKVADDGMQDISAINKALSSLLDTKGTVVLRSTIIPGSLKDLQFDFYLPEFLHEKNAVPECSSPHFFVIGTRNRKPEPAFFADWQRRAYKTFRGTPEEASYIKYLSNLWNALRIAFVNEYGDVIKKPQNQDDVREIERVIDFIFDGKFYMRYGKAFGGHCLPKDTRAFIRAARDRGIETPLLEGTYKTNEMHRKMQTESILPEWFSAWEKPMLSGRAALQALIAATARRLRSPFSRRSL